MSERCPLCGHKAVIALAITDDMLGRAIAAYEQMGRVDCEADHADAMREALEAALEVRP